MGIYFSINEVENFEQKQPISSFLLDVTYKKVLGC